MNFSEQDVICSYWPLTCTALGYSKKKMTEINVLTL